MMITMIKMCFYFTVNYKIESKTISQSLKENLDRFQSK